MAATATELRILAQVERRLEEMVALTARLVRINTVNPYSGDGSAGTEKPGQELMRRELKAAGALVESVPVPEDIYRQCGVLGPQGRSWKGRYNVLGRFQLPLRGKGRPGTNRPKRPAALAARGRGKTLILNCHMDTVGVEGYEGNPFEGVVREARLWGRGSTDSKGNLAIGLTAIKGPPFRRREPRGRNPLRERRGRGVQRDGGGNAGLPQGGHSGRCLLRAGRQRVLPVSRVRRRGHAEIEVDLPQRPLRVRGGQRYREADGSQGRDRPIPGAGGGR